MVQFEYHAVQGGAYDLDFECSHCGARAHARAVGVGQGSARASMFRATHEARAEAAGRADERAVVNARARVDLARCPRCGRRDGLPVTVLWLLDPLIAAGVSALVALPFALFQWLTWRGAARVVFAPVEERREEAPRAAGVPGKRRKRRRAGKDHPQG
jgi:hypothetical protein